MQIKDAMLLLIILGLLGVILRDFHLRGVETAMHAGYFEGYVMGERIGKLQCPLPRV